MFTNRSRLYFQSTVLFDSPLTESLSKAELLRLCLNAKLCSRSFRHNLSLLRTGQDIYTRDVKQYYINHCYSLRYQSVRCNRPLKRTIVFQCRICSCDIKRLQRYDILFKDTFKADYVIQQWSAAVCVCG